MPSRALHAKLTALLMVSLASADSLAPVPPDPKDGIGRYGSLIVFGASYCDVANRKSGPTDGGYTSWPSKEGRWSNGDLWPEYLKKFIGPEKDKDADLLDYAEAGAHITKAVTGSSEGAKDMVQQVSDHVTAFKDAVADSPLKTASSLYIAWIGLNPLGDLLKNATDAGLDNTANNDKIKAAVGLIMTAMTDSLKTLAALRNADLHYGLVIIDLPDLRYLPKHVKDADDAKLKYASNLAKSYNDGLRKVVDDLKAIGMRTSLSSVNKTWTDYVNRPVEYGLGDDVAKLLSATATNKLTNNEENMKRILLTAQTDVPSKDDEKTKKAAGYLYWDELHPTTRFHEDIARRLASWLGGN